MSLSMRVLDVKINLKVIMPGIQFLQVNVLLNVSELGTVFSSFLQPKSL